MKILDSTGRLIAVVFDGNAGGPADFRLSQDPFLLDGTNTLGLEPLNHDWAAAWDGRDKDGVLVQGGLYFIQARWQLDAQDETRVKPFSVVLASHGFTNGMFLVPNPAGSGNRPDEVTLFWQPGLAGQTLHMDVFNLAGEAVRHFEVDGSAGRLWWDLKTPSGQIVANGIYIVRVGVLSPNQELLESRILKLAILRE